MSNINENLSPKFSEETRKQIEAFVVNIKDDVYRVDLGMSRIAMKYEAWLKQDPTPAAVKYVNAYMQEAGVSKGYLSKLNTVRKKRFELTEQIVPDEMVQWYEELPSTVAYSLSKLSLSELTVAWQDGVSSTKSAQAVIEKISSKSKSPFTQTSSQTDTEKFTNPDHSSKPKQPEYQTDSDPDWNKVFHIDANNQTAAKALVNSDYSPHITKPEVAIAVQHIQRDEANLVSLLKHWLSKEHLFQRLLEDVELKEMLHHAMRTSSAIRIHQTHADRNARVSSDKYV